MKSNIIANFGVLYRTFLAYTNEYLSGTDISFSESIVIANVGAREGITQEEISLNLAIDRAAVARNVKLLAGKDFIRIDKNEKDRRQNNLYLTDKGKELYALICNENLKRLTDLFDGISESDKEIFASVLEKIAERAK